jgi:hypothetical protein
MKLRRLTALSGLAFGVSLAMLTPAVAGADTLADPGSTSTQADSVSTSPDFAAFQSGNRETPPNGSPAWSYAVFSLSADGSTLTYGARAFGLANPSGAHLHMAPPGVAGPIVVPLDVPGQPGSSGCVNVATGATFERAATGSGAVSGCESVFPSGTSTGSSTTFRSVDESCRHLLGRSAGTPRGTGICGFADISGTITAADLTGPLAGKTMADLVAAIRAGNIYINLHTTAFPAGEIRGQLTATNATARSTTGSTSSGSNTNTIDANHSTDSHDKSMS